MRNICDTPYLGYMMNVDVDADEHEMSHELNIAIMGVFCFLVLAFDPVFPALHRRRTTAYTSGSDGLR